MNLTHTLELFDTPKPGRVERSITAQDKGRVFYEGTYWPAQLYPVVAGVNYALTPSSLVTVIGRQGLTLLVSPPIAAAYA
jgi:membrane protein implicated in regulation of membrane protease activity